MSDEQFNQLVDQAIELMDRACALLDQAYEAHMEAVGYEVRS